MAQTNTERRPDNSQTIHVLALDLGGQDAIVFAQDKAALCRALGVDDLDMEKVERLRPRDLESVGLSGYLTEGEGADPQAVRPDESRLGALDGHVLILRPGALPDGVAPRPDTPLRLVGRYPLEKAAPARGTLRSTGAEGLVTGAPPAATDPRDEKRISGYVALGALAVALLIVVIVVVVAI